MSPALRRRLWILIVAGSLVRLALLTMPGTPDVRTWKAWSYQGATDVTGMYGVGGQPPERGLIRWQDIVGTTEYPPLALYQMAIVGRVYAPADPDYDDTALLTAFIKVPGLVAEGLLVLALLTWGRRALGLDAAVWMAMAWWLNPAVIINGAALGYLDAQMAVPAVLAMLAAGTGRPALAGVLIAVAVLTKAQAVIVGPALLVALWRQSHVRPARAYAWFITAGLATTVVAILPIVIRGGFWNMVQALGRLGAHDMVSGQATNAWWIFTWIIRAIYSLDLGIWTAFTLPVRILEISRLEELGFVGVKPLGIAIVVGLIGWTLWRMRGERRLDGWAWLAGSCVLSYFMWNTQVHENHLYLAVPMFALAGAIDPRRRRTFWMVSAITAFNMYLFYGVGTGRLPWLGRGWTVVDATVVASVLSLWVWRRVFLSSDVTTPRS